MDIRIWKALTLFFGLLTIIFFVSFMVLLTLPPAGTPPSCGCENCPCDTCCNTDTRQCFPKITQNARLAHSFKFKLNGVDKYLQEDFTFGDERTAIVCSYVDGKIQTSDFRFLRINTCEPHDHAYFTWSNNVGDYSELWSFDGLAFYGNLPESCQVKNTVYMLSTCGRGDNSTLGIFAVPKYTFGNWNVEQLSIIITK